MQTEQTMPLAMITRMGHLCSHKVDDQDTMARKWADIITPISIDGVCSVLDYLLDSPTREAFGPTFRLKAAQALGFLTDEAVSIDSSSAPIATALPETEIGRRIAFVTGRKHSDGTSFIDAIELYADLSADR